MVSRIKWETSENLVRARRRKRILYALSALFAAEKRMPLGLPEKADSALRRAGRPDL